MNTRYLILPAIVVADILSKREEHLEFTNHFVDPRHIIIPVSIIALLICLRYRHVMLSVSIVITGAFLNYLDSLDGVVINPYVVISGDFGMAFNVADMAIIGGMAATLATIVNKQSRASV